jgi:hypothetical protein
VFAKSTDNKICSNLIQVSALPLVWMAWLGDCFPRAQDMPQAADGQISACAKRRTGEIGMLSNLVMVFQIRCLRMAVHCAEKIEETVREGEMGWEALEK